MGTSIRIQPQHHTMKIIAVLLVVVAVAQTRGEGTEHPLVPCPQEVSDKCPETDPANPVYFAHPDSCSKFCICSGGRAFEEICMPGLVWDNKLHVCNWPSMVDCEGRPLAL